LRRAGVVKEEEALKVAKRHAEHTSNMHKNKIEIISENLTASTTEADMSATKVSEFATQLANPNTTPSRPQGLNPEWSITKNCTKKQPTTLNNILKS